MPDSKAKREWMKENSINLTVKLMKKADMDIICFLGEMSDNGTPKGAVIKLALREYIKNHSDHSEED